MENQEQSGKRLQNIDDHIADLRFKLTQNSECGTTHYNLAVALMGKKEYDEAESVLHDAIDNSPSLAEAYVLLGGICLQRKDLEGCLRYNKYAVKARVGFAEGYGNIAFVLLQQCVGTDPAEDTKKIDEAIKMLKKAIVHNSKFVQAFTTLGTAYFMKGLIKEAIEANKEAVKIQPDFPIAHNNLAVAYLELKDYKKALEHCDKAVEFGYDIPEELIAELEPHR
ncbi:MAG: tetratricopeptide repeat protein [Desulfobacteraceae bacterium]|nr:tetratricopeptide repeat protein [Desulfobacteraceae bacterium]